LKLLLVKKQLDFLVSWFIIDKLEHLLYQQMICH